MTGPICHINLARGYRGGERQTELLIRALSGLGFRQRLIARKGDVLQARLSDLQGLEIVAIHQPFMPQAWVCRGSAVIQVHEAKGGHLACIAHSLYGIPYVLTRRVDKPPKTSALNRRLYRNASVVVAVSAMIAEVLRRTRLATDVNVIHDAHSQLPVDSHKAESIRSRFAGRFLIGHAGALVDRHKGQGTLIRAMRKLAGEEPDLQLLLMGSGEDEAELRRLAQGLDNVSFEGFIDGLGDYLAALDLFVYPSNFEGLGSVLLDAMHAELAIIASQVGGIPEIVQHGDNGLLVPPGDVDALASAIRELKNNAELRQQLAMQGRAKAEAYSPEAMARQYAALYQQIGGG